MTSEDADWDVEWDDTVDVICVGSGPGLLAYAIACAAAELDVLLAGSPPEHDTGTAVYLSAMTEDLAGLPLDGDSTRGGLAYTRAEVVESGSGRPTPVETFVGEELRQWSACCVASPFGVMFTDVPQVLTPMRTECGELITACLLGAGPGPAVPVSTWLDGRADDYGIAGTDEVFAGLVHQYGRIVGAVLQGPSGRRLVGAKAGLAFPVGPPAAPGVMFPPPPHPEAAVTVALVGRRAGRFAKLEMLLTRERP